MILKGAKSLFHNPFGKNKANKLTEAAIILPACFGCVQGALALDAVGDGYDKNYRIEKELAVAVSAAATAGGIFGVAGAVAAGVGFHMLSEDIKQYIV